MRFRQKLSIVLVGLTLLPLVAASVLVALLLTRQHTTATDGQLRAAVAAGAALYRAEVRSAPAAAAQIAARPDVQQAFRRHNSAAVRPAALTGPYAVALVDHGRLLAGRLPRPGDWRTSVRVGSASREVVVSLPFDRGLLERLVAGLPRQQGVGLALVDGGRVAAADPSGDGSLRGALPVSGGGGIELGGRSVRALAIPVPAAAGTRRDVVATYPAGALDSQLNGIRARVLAPALVLAVVIGALALTAAERISRALSELSSRALALAHGEVGAPAVERAGEGGDELAELDAVLDTMSSELAARMSALEGERARLKRTLVRYGQTLAATHDMRALLGAVLDTAVQATRARGGRLMLYDPDLEEAAEQVRIGTALGSRADLPMNVRVADGLEGDVLATAEPRIEPGPRTKLAVPIGLDGAPLGVLTVVDAEDDREFDEDDANTLAGLASQAAVAIDNVRLHRMVEQQAVSDALTGLANRRQFYDALGREYERAQRFDQPLALIILDIDNFKGINDTRGHLAGDAVLRSVAGTVAGLIREIDVAARYGGEEFAVLLPQTDTDGATRLAERLREAVAAAAVPFGDGEIPAVTASFGVAAGPAEGMTEVDLIAAADAALYIAKRTGKDRVVRADESSSEPNPAVEVGSQSPA